MAVDDADNSRLLVDSKSKLADLVWGPAATRRCVCIHQMNLVDSCNYFAIMTAL